jgi:anaerobic magnesium-protoporphyrin IX monomethyl ester cyclase
MSDVLLGQAYYLRFDPKLWRAAQPYPPLGTMYAAAYLRARGVAPALFDAMLADSEREWGEALARVRPRVAVIYEDSFNYLSKMCLLRMRQAAMAMIDQARARQCPVIVSGSDATDHPEVYLARGAAAVIVGEGELTLADLVNRLMAGGSLADVDGLVYLDDTGAMRRTPPRPFVRGLDELPLPAWDLVDIDRYRRVWRSRHGYHSMNVATTRGCPYHCNWCAKPIYGQRYAVRSPANVVAELAMLVDRYQPDHFAFVDDVFGLQPGWLDAFAARVREAGIDVPFRCLMRADQVGESTVQSLYTAGCRMVWLGAESGSQRVLDAMEKGIRVEQIRHATRRLHDAGIRVGFFLQFGYPGETWDDIEATLGLMRELRPDDIGVSVSYPLPGTRFHDRVQAELGQKQNWFDSNDLAMMYRATYTPAFYRVLHRLVHHEFRAGRAAEVAYRVLRRPWRARPRHVRQLAAWAFNRSALPVVRRRLQRLASDGRQVPRPAKLFPLLSPGAAATPSPQDE